MLEYLPAWGMDDQATRAALSGRWLNDTMYTLCRYYEGAATREDRMAVLSFDWNAFLPSVVREGEQPYGNPIYWQLYVWWKEKQYGRIKRFFARRKWQRTLKNWKKRIKG